MYGSWSVLRAAFLPVQSMVFCLSCPRIFVRLVLGFIVCLVSSFRYNGLATLALAAFGRVRALRARCGHFGPAAGPPGPLQALRARTGGVLGSTSIGSKELSA